MALNERDTIYALSSGGLPSGVAVLRVSGSRTAFVLQSLCGGVPSARIATLRSIRDRNGLVIDQGLIVYFPAPRSFTGEDCAELQVHGGRAVVNATLQELSLIEGLRHAEAGEFSKRAFENGKLDLVEIEGLADLIGAETEMQRRLALEHSRGGVSSLYTGWTRRLIHARAMIEAELDFSDEDDVPGSVASGIWNDMALLSQEIGNHIEGGKISEIIRNGLNVVIVGAPNAGKSSLLNFLAKRDIAIVTEIAGTTRDVLSVDLTIAGFAVRLFDTAGLRQTEDVVEREGIRRAQLALETAHLVLAVSETPEGFPDLSGNTINAPIIRVATKIDKSEHLWNKADADVTLSVLNGSGIAELITAISDYLPMVEGANAFALPSRQRHLSCLQEAKQHIESSLISRRGLDLQAEDLRQAGDAIGRITGRIDVEDLLDVIFSEFCIGK